MMSANENNSVFNVIIPFYNSAEYLLECIESLRQQTCGYENIHVILVNDGSTDRKSSTQTVARMFSSDPQIDIYETKHSGPSAARNLGLEHADGEFIVFLDSDDMLDPTYLECGLKAARKFPDCDVFYFPMKIMGTDTLDWNRVHFKSGKKEVLYDYNLGKPTVLPSNVASSIIRSSVISEGVRFNTNMCYGEDGCFNALCVLRNLQLCCINDGCYYERRKRDNSLSTHVKDSEYFTGSAAETMWTLPHVAFSIYERTPARVRYLDQFIRNGVGYRTKCLRAMGDVPGVRSNCIDGACSELVSLSRLDTSSMPLISLVIPCHEEVGTIEKIVCKLKSQTFKEWECICIDDSQQSKDVEELLKQLSGSDKRIRFFRNASDPGAGASRNIGLKESRGRYIWFIDSDDELSFGSDGLREVFNELLKKKADVHVFPTAMWVNNRYINSFLDVRASDLWFYKKEFMTREELLKRSDKFKDFLQMIKMNPWCKILDREFLLTHSDRVHFQNTHFSNDNFFSVGILMNFRSAAFHAMKPIYRYNRSSTSISNPKNRSEHLGDVALLLDWMLKIDTGDEFGRIVFIDRVKSIETILVQIMEYRNAGDGTAHDEFIREVATLVGGILNKSHEFESLCGNLPLLNEVRKHFSETRTKSSDKPIVGKRLITTSSSEHDAVFILGNGSIYKDLELKFAMHSLHKFCPFVRNVFVVGSKPRCDLSNYNFKFIPCRDPYTGNKDANIMFKIKAAINKIPDLSEDFLLCSDDQLVTKPCVWEDFKPKYIKKMYTGTIPHASGNGWTYRLAKTLKSALARRNAAWFYEPHIWSPINKTAFIEMYKEIKDPSDFTIVFTQYYNSIDCLDHEKIHDHEFYFECKSDWSEDFKSPPRFIAYNDKAFECEQFRQQLALLLK